MNERTCSAKLAEWITNTSTTDLPKYVHDAVEFTVIDTVALTIAALETDYGVAIRQAFDSRGSCTVWGCGSNFDMASAAVINGTCGHGEDYDNTYEGCPMHSGVVIVPAIFAAGEALALRNSDVIKGLAIGIEVANRLGLVAGKSVHKAGFHPTAILGTTAAAAGVAAACGQSAQQIKNTLGIAGSLASGIIEYLADGSWTKRLHAGWAAQSGIRAAQMGAAGFTGPETVFEGVHGLYAAFAPSLTPDFDLLCNQLGSDWQSANVAFKPYACGTMTQPYVDCAIQLRNRGIAAKDIVSMVCEVGEGTVHRLWEPLPLKQSPPTAYAAKFSTPYTIAAGLLHGDVGLAQFTDEAVSDPDALTLAAKVNYVIDPNNDYPKNYSGHIRAVLTDGSVIEEHQPHLRGGSKQRLTREEIVRKAEANLAFCGKGKNAVDALQELASQMITYPDKPFCLSTFVA
ncbi:MAG: MmgE/PrpD family protein [Gammaproteobacteria bacterium]|nr:MmgE/PrpD family protein [Gammaproteobacteria bacterium]